MRGIFFIRLREDPFPDSVLLSFEQSTITWRSLWDRIPDLWHLVLDLERESSEIAVLKTKQVESQNLLVFLSN